MVSFTDHIMLLLLVDFPKKLKLEKINDTLVILCYVDLSSSQLQKARRNLQQGTAGNTSILFLKRIMLGNFLKIRPLNKILEFQD